MKVTAPEQIPSILVVDDQPGNVMLLVRMLAERGYLPRPVLSGRQALVEARADPPDLILLDISMPEMNGYQVCEQLKADAALKDIPVIFVSALNETMDKVRAFRVGGVDYVTKPFQFEEVYARVKTHLQLRRLEKLHADLTLMVIHDLRNPLTVICGHLEMLEFDPTLNVGGEAMALVSGARRSAEDLINLVGSLLDFGKMGAGEMKLRHEACDVNVLIRRVLANLQPLPGRRTVTVDAPESTAVVMADLCLIRRVLQNLLGNALKFAPAGGVIRIGVAANACEVRFTVTDDGPGIAPAHQQRIFEKFGQLEGPQSHLGTGLGLAFCKMAVEAHGGRIGVDSDPGKGSTFWVTLPRMLDEAAPLPRVESPPARQDAPGEKCAGDVVCVEHHELPAA